jgi:hypothetical protein
VARSNDVAAQPASTPGRTTTGTQPLDQLPAAALIQLGWTAQRLDRARPRRVMASTGLPDRLSGLSGHGEFDCARVDLTLASTWVAPIAATLSWPTDRVPELTAVTTAAHAHGAALADRLCGRRRHGGPHRGGLGDLRLRRDRWWEGRRTAQRSGGLPRVVRPDGRHPEQGAAYKAGMPL